jgi:hypothetical protein
MVGKLSTWAIQIRIDLHINSYDLDVNSISEIRQTENVIITRRQSLWYIYNEWQLPYLACSFVPSFRQLILTARLTD